MFVEDNTKPLNRCECSKCGEQGDIMIYKDQKRSNGVCGECEKGVGLGLMTAAFPSEDDDFSNRCLRIKLVKGNANVSVSLKREESIFDDGLLITISVECAGRINGSGNAEVSCASCDLLVEDAHKDFSSSELTGKTKAFFNVITRAKVTSDDYDDPCTFFEVLKLDSRLIRESVKKGDVSIEDESSAVNARTVFLGRRCNVAIYTPEIEEGVRAMNEQQLRRYFSDVRGGLGGDELEMVRRLPSSSGIIFTRTDFNGKLGEDVLVKAARGTGLEGSGDTAATGCETVCEGDNDAVFCR